MRFGNYRLQVDPGHLLLLVALAGFVIWYARDARKASPFIENTILILPASILAVVLVVLIVPQAVRLRRADRDDVPAPALAGVRDWFARNGEERSALTLMVLLGGFVASAPFIGFDLATFLFLAGTLLALGERRWWVVAGFSLLLSGALVGGMLAALSLDIPTTVL